VKAVTMIMLALALAGAGARSACAQAGGQTAPPGAAPPAGRQESRADILRAIEPLDDVLENTPGDEAARFKYAELLYESGSFAQAREAVTPLLRARKPSLDALGLGARLAFLLGDYDAAEGLFAELMRRDPSDPHAVTGLILTYYQTNAFARAAELPEKVRDAVQFPYLDLMLAFGDEAPYRVTWAGEHRTSVPFVVSDPLPVIEVEIAGRHVNAIIDTGADVFILDTEVAKSLGIERITSMMGMFAGGMQAEIGFGRTDSLGIGGATLHSVPVSILPTGRLTFGQAKIGGIVGTGVLKQFLATIDYPNNQLVLSERTPKAGDFFLAEAGDRIADVIPFYLQGTHFILAHGSLDGYQALLFHVDTGLAGIPSFAAPKETLEYVGIPIPEVAVREDVIGGAGGGFPTGTFEIKELGLGRLERADLVGSYGGQPPGSYWGLGFILDGLISQNFLSDHAWTFDFDGMRMIATR
jgi:hypothetical protein